LAIIPILPAILKPLSFLLEPFSALVSLILIFGLLHKGFCYSPQDDFS
jgi:hypothetical protein